MRKIIFLFAVVLSMMTWTGVMAQDTNSAEYQAALNAIVDGSDYRIKTTVSGTDYYVTTSGTLTSVKDDAGIFTITKTSGGYFGTGFRIDSGSERFTNPPLSNNVANLKPGQFSYTSGDRADWERQILYLNSDGMYAIRSCNVQDGTSGWADAARTHWTYYMVGDVVTPCYSYTPDYIWDLGTSTFVNVTYKLMEGGTEVSSTTVRQEANSAVNIPKSITSVSYNGFWHEIFYYDYTTEGTIGDSDCTIIVNRTVKAGTVHALADLSNAKAYNIGCDRGAMLTNGTTIASTASSGYASASPGQFAIINYEDNYYLYSVADGKFVANDGYLVEKPSNGVLDALQMTPKTEPYFFFYFTVAEGTNYGVNTNGTGNLGGIVINSWMNVDPGNQYYMVEAADFDPTAALKTLNNDFHPAYNVIYVVKDEQGTVIFSSGEQPTTEGTHITTLPAEYQRPFYTYSETDVEITTLVTTVEFTATWTGPFKISTDFDNAQWQNMAMRGTWYLTSAVKDGDGAYKTQNANTMSLVEDSYQWAFVGNGYDGFSIINKAEGDGKSFGWTDATATNAGIPTIMDDNVGHHAWKIVASTNTSVPAGSFCLNVPGTNLYINQYGGAGGSVKFWNSSNNVSDLGSAFTVFDVPDNLASFVEEEISPALEATGYFAFTDAAKAAIGYDESMKIYCSLADYTSMKENLDVAMGDINNFVLPETGVYFLKSKYYPDKGFMGMDPSDAYMYGDYAKIKDVRNYVTLIKTGAATYKISLMGKYAPVEVKQSTPVVASTEAGIYTVVITKPGYAAFQADTEAQYSALHRRAEGDIVGWEPTADASMWAVTDAKSINLTIGVAGYATAYLPFPVEIGNTLAVPASKGAWTFDDGTTGTLEATAGVTIADGVANVPAGDNLAMATGVEELGTYTFMFDVMLPADKGTDSSLGAYSAIFQNEPANDGSLFFYWHKTNGRRIGINTSGLGYGGSIECGTWYRVVFVSENSTATVYVNGVKTGAATSAVAEHWTLKDKVLFFADNDGEDNEMKADEIRFWDIALTDEEVAVLGAYGDVVPEPTAVAAYTVQITNNDNNNSKNLTLNKLDGIIPTRTAVVLKSAPNTYVVCNVAAEAAPVINNDLMGTLENLTTDGAQYVLAKRQNKVGFARAITGTKLAPGKGYLVITGGAGVKPFYPFEDGDATGIESINEHSTLDSEREDGLIFNLAGQRLQKMQKGINIINGKKVLK